MVKCAKWGITWIDWGFQYAYKKHNHNGILSSAGYEKQKQWINFTYESTRKESWILSGIAGRLPDHEGRAWNVQDQSRYE